MGADLLILTLDWPTRKGQSHEEGFIQCCEAIDKRIDKIKKVDFNGGDPSQINDDWELCGDKTVWYTGTEEAPEVTLDQYKQCLYDLVDEIRLSWGGRDTTFHTIGNWSILITGGMSYGDSPTDTFGMLTKLYAAGVV